MSDAGGRFNLTKEPSRFGIDLQQVASPSSGPPDRLEAANQPWYMSANLVITLVTILTVLCVLLVLKPGFVMYRGKTGKPRVCLQKLIVWLVVTLVIVHFHEKMRYFYGLLLQPMCAVVNKAWGSVFT